MSAFMDSGHRWWMQCPSCGMAWFLGAAPPGGEDSEDECSTCKRGGDNGIAHAARAEGYEQARAQAARICHEVGTAPECPWEYDVDEAERRIRTMQPEGGES